MNIRTVTKSTVMVAVIIASAGCGTAPNELMKLNRNMIAIPGKNYSMCKHEVSQALWECVMGDNPSKFKGSDMPVEEVSWYNCQEFLEKLNTMPDIKASGRTYRLPTAEEWEFACRANATNDYCRLANGTEITKETLGKVAWYNGNSFNKPHPIGKKKPNAFGIYDMHGNVWEWTASANDNNRINCGGSWCFSAVLCAASHRLGDSPDYRDNNIGLRLACDNVK